MFKYLKEKKIKSLLLDKAKEQTRCNTLKDFFERTSSTYYADQYIDSKVNLTGINYKLKMLTTKKTVYGLVSECAQ